MSAIDAGAEIEIQRPLAPDLPNVLYASPIYRFGDLCEASYLTGTLRALHRQLGDAFLDLDLIVYSSERSPPLPLLPNGRRKVVIVISEETGWVPDAMAREVLAVFKCYLPDEHGVANLFPFPLGTVGAVPHLPVRDVADRHLDLFFSGNLNDYRLEMYRCLSPFRWVPAPLFRRLAVRLLTRLPLDVSARYPRSLLRFSNGFRQGMAPEAYAEAMYDSRVVLCPGGFRSPETFRHFEAMRAGCVVVSPPLPRHPFYLGSPIVTIQAWSDLDRTLGDLFRDEDRLADLHRKTVDWWATRCSEEAAAVYVAERLQRLGL